MNIVITGGTGFLGSALARQLIARGDDVIVLSRGASSAVPGARVVRWQPDAEPGEWRQAIDGSHAVVNLAGESIAGKRWSADQKRRILDSRLHATRALVDAIRQTASPPAVLLSGSAVGYYGPCGDEVITDDSPAGSDFLADVCRQWEAEASRAASAQTRVACIRTGLVLGLEGGALPQMLPPFKFGVGGPVGSGRQYWPWIHRDDWVAVAQWILDSTPVSGPVNATAPSPTPNAEFARSLGRAMHRPAFMPAPAFALRLLLGEMADALLLSGQRAVPAKAERLGYRFRYRTADEALAALFR
jgi:uncharacterized protein (TIGR01777 family)